MLASSHFDPVLGIDIHWELVPMPAPVPTPIPNPFTGIVFDPMGLAVGLAISNAIGMAMGASFQGPIIYWGFAPATNTGTEAKHIPGHILIPPGTGWAPVPKVPKPKVRPNERLKPPKPIAPDNDAVVITGSKTVYVSGSNAARMGDMLMSCSEPVRLPSSVIIAVPKGAPILIGGPPALDLQAAIMASLKTRFIGDTIQSGITRLPIGRRGRAALSKVACFLTGHPVDVVSGKVFTDAVDAELPGPIALTIERTYYSSFGSRKGPLGRGWSLSIEQALWEERGKVVYLAGDGREIEFDCFDFPDHRMNVGDEVFHPVDRLRLRREKGDRWRILTAAGLEYEFGSVQGTRTASCRLLRIATPSGDHAITFTYDRHGQLEWVRDSVGRLVGLERDVEGRIVTLKMPLPHERGWYAHRRYLYDAEGDLVRVVDSKKNAWTFEYVTHLMVRETDRNGFNFYFEYDGTGEDAYCTRTWGDGGLMDHVIAYDKRNHVSIVTDSLGNATKYVQNEMGLVTKIVDPLGSEITYEYDPRSLQRTRTIDSLGRTLTKTYDDHGDVTSVEYPDGSHIHIEYAGMGRPVRLVHSDGRQWHHRYDAFGHLIERKNPDGATTRWEWAAGLLRAVLGPNGYRTDYTYQDHQISIVRDARGSETRYSWTNQGQIRKVVDARGGIARVHYDSEGHLLRLDGPLGPQFALEHDANGNVVVVETPTKRVRFTYGCFNRIVERNESGLVYRYEYDTEARVARVVNDLGEPHLLTRDACGRVIATADFDGSVTKIVRDVCGRVQKIVRADGQCTTVQHDSVDRIVRADFGDGSFTSLDYGIDGSITRAENEFGTVRCDYDAVGRLVRETREDADGETFWVESAYDARGYPVALGTSLGARQTIERDALGSALALHHASADAPNETASIAFERNATGWETGRVLPGGVRLDTRYDDRGRATERTLVAASREPLFSERLTWLNDRISEVRALTGEPTRYDHDPWGRLVAESRGGDRTKRKVAPLGTHAADSARTYGSGRRLVVDRDRAEGDETLEYDGGGNLVRQASADGSERRYTWSASGRLKSVDLPDGRSVRFQYDAYGRRIRKTVMRADRSDVVERDVRFVWSGSVVVHEVDVSGGRDVSTWHWEPGTFRPVVSIRDGVSRAVIADAAGVPVRMLDARGQTVWSASPSVNGEIRVEVGERQDCPWRGDGLYEDAETGLFYNRHRYFDPKLGRYVSKDPIGIFGGMDPYGPVDNPLTESDPLGLAKGNCGPTEPLPENCAIVHVTNTHAAITVVMDGEQQMSTHLVMGEGAVRDPNVRGAATWDGQPTEIWDDISGVGTKKDPKVDIVVPFKDSDAARAALEHQQAVNGLPAGPYKYGENSCVTHVNDVLNAGGVPSDHPVMTGFSKYLQGLPGASKL